MIRVLLSSLICLASIFAFGQDSLANKTAAEKQEQANKAKNTVAPSDKDKQTGDATKTKPVDKEKDAETTNVVVAGPPIPSSAVDDINFIMLYPKNERDSVPSQFFLKPKDSVELKNFYKKYSARSLPVYMVKGEYLLDMPCSGVIGICLDPDLHQTFKFTLQIKNAHGDSFTIDIKSIKGRLTKSAGVSNDKKGLLYINLSEALKKFYYEKPSNEMTCCPEEDLRNAHAEAFKKVCHVLSLRGGLVMEVDGPTFKYKSSGLSGSSYGNSKDPKAENVPKIDPRKFMVIQEHDRKSKKVNTVWDNSKQFKNVVDSRNELIIQFKQDALKEEIFFEGNISVMAQIDDKDPIEIPPYAVIGENYSTVGTRSLSPYDFALSFLTQMMNVYNIYDKSPTFKKLKTKLEKNDYNQDLFDWLNDDGTSKTISDKINKHLGDRTADYVKNRNTLRGSMRLNPTARVFIKETFNEIYKSLHLEQYFDLSLAKWKEVLDPTKFASEPGIQAAVTNLELYIDQLILTQEHPDFYFGRADSLVIGPLLDVYFSAAGRKDVLAKIYENMYTPQASSINEVLAIVAANKPPEGTRKNVTISNLLYSYYVPQLSFALRNLKETKDYFDKFMKTDRATLYALLTELQRDSLFLTHSVSSINQNFSELKKIDDELTAVINLLSADPSVGPATRYKLEDIAARFQGQMNWFVAIFKDIREYEQKEYDEAREYFKLKRNIPHPGNTPAFIADWAEFLAARASRQLYKKLIDGKIDLSKRTLSDDSKITIYILWSVEPGKPAQKLPVASFTLRKLGWNESITDSFLLINRTGVTDESSRFKGAYGASLMWTYTSGENGDFFQRVQPSIGINVAYVDFTSDETFELGVGVLVGLWKNKVFVGWGRNLHVNEAPGYFALGFSFGNLAGNFGGKKPN